MQWTKGKCLSEKRISKPTNCLWQAGFFRYQVHEWTKTLQKIATFDFESIFVQEVTLKDTNTATWIGKHVPISGSNSSNIVEEPIFHCNSDPNHLVGSFSGALENLGSRSKAKMKNLFLIDLQESLERYCNVLSVFGFNSAKYDLNLIKSYLLPILINERDVEPTVIKKTNQFI